MSRVSELALQEGGIENYFLLVDKSTDPNSKKIALDKFVLVGGTYIGSFLRCLPDGGAINTTAGTYGNKVFVHGKGVYQWLAENPVTGYAEIVAASGGGFWCLAYPLYRVPATVTLSIESGTVTHSRAAGPHGELANIAPGTYTLALTNMNDGDSVKLLFKRNAAAGAVTLNLPANSHVMNSDVHTSIALTSDANGMDLLEGTKIGSKTYFRLNADI